VLLEIVEGSLVVSWTFTGNEALLDTWAVSLFPCGDPEGGVDSATPAPGLRQHNFGSSFDPGSYQVSIRGLPLEGEPCAILFSECVDFPGE